MDVSNQKNGSHNDITAQKINPKAVIDLKILPVCSLVLQIVPVWLSVLLRIGLFQQCTPELSSLCWVDK